MVDTIKSEPERGTLPSARRKPVTVFGGTGFLGRRIVRHLLEHNFEVRAVSRRTERAGLLFRSTCLGLTVIKGDVRDRAAVVGSLTGAYGAVNAVSLYVERGRDSFQAVHVEAAASVAILAREAGVKRLVHISGIGADPASASSYISARGRGEKAVQRAFPDAVLVRPAVMFGTDGLPNETGQASSDSPRVSRIRQRAYEAATSFCGRCCRGDQPPGGASRRS